MTCFACKDKEGISRCTSGIRWSDLLPELERQKKIEAQRKVDEQLAEVDRILAAFMTPEERLKAFEIWKAALYEMKKP